MSIGFTAVSADNTDPRDTGWIGEIWETARQRMRLAHAGEYLLVIDEVHKIDNWSEAVKKEWDADTFNDVKIKVVLLGSSRLLLKNGLTESLAGRYELIRMPHWSYTEVKEAFGMEIKEMSKDCFAMDMHYCPHLKGWQDMGMSDEMCAKLCDLAMEGDYAMAKEMGFDFENSMRLANGDPVCRVVYRVRKENAAEEKKD